MQHKQLQHLQLEQHLFSVQFPLHFGYYHYVLLQSAFYTGW